MTETEGRRPDAEESVPGAASGVRAPRPRGESIPVPRQASYADRASLREEQRMVMDSESEQERWAEARESLGTGAPTLLLGTSSRALDKWAARLAAASQSSGHNRSRSPRWLEAIRKPRSRRTIDASQQSTISKGSPTRDHSDEADDQASKE